MTRKEATDFITFIEDKKHNRFSVLSKATAREIILLAELPIPYCRIDSNNSHKYNLGGVNIECVELRTAGVFTFSIAGGISISETSMLDAFIKRDPLIWMVGYDIFDEKVLANLSVKEKAEATNLLRHDPKTAWSILNNQLPVFEEITYNKEWLYK